MILHKMQETAPVMFCNSGPHMYYFIIITNIDLLLFVGEWELLFLSDPFIIELISFLNGVHSDNPSGLMKLIYLFLGDLLIGTAQSFDVEFGKMRLLH